MEKTRIPGLLDEDFIACYPSLAVRAGINEALILQKLHFLLRITEKAKNEASHFAGRWWVYNTYAQWQREHFPWLSTGTIKRLFLDLEKEGVVMSWTPIPHQETYFPGMPPCPAAVQESTKFYTIRYEHWESWLAAAPSQKETRGVSQNDPTPVTKRDEGVSQNDPTPVTKRDALPIYIDSQNLPEPTSEPTALASGASGDSVGATTPVTGPPGGRPRARSSRSAPKSDTVPKTLMDPMKNAIIAAFGWSWSTATDSEIGMIQRAARELCKANASPSEIPGLYHYCASHFTMFKPMALASNLSDYRKGESTHGSRHSRAGQPPTQPGGRKRDDPEGTGSSPGTARRGAAEEGFTAIIRQGDPEVAARKLAEIRARRDAERAAEQQAKQLP